MLVVGCNTDETLTTFGANVRRQRLAQGLSQERLALLAKLDRTYISGVERGVRNPSLKKVCEFARALGVSPAILLEGVKG